MPTPAERVFVVANSMREVQPEINLLVSPSPDRLAFKEPVGSPDWTFPEEVDDVSERHRLTPRRRRRDRRQLGAASVRPSTSTRSPTSRPTSPRTGARVGSVRPSALLYTNGIGATVDLPHLVGDAARTRRLGADLRAPARPGRGHRRAAAARTGPLASRQPGRPSSASRRGHRRRREHSRRRCHRPRDPGPDLPAVVALHRLQPARPRLRSSSSRTGTPTAYRPDQAQFVHEKCTGWAGQTEAGATARSPRTSLPSPRAISSPASNGHLDEFPYVAWVHRGKPCPERAIPRLRMREWKSNIGPDVQIMCTSATSAAGMLEATGPKARRRSSRAAAGGTRTSTPSTTCDQPGKLMMLGAANQWFSITLGLLALPREEAASAADLVPISRRCRQAVLAAAAVKEALADVPDARRRWQAQTDAFDDGRRRRAVGGDPARDGRRSPPETTSGRGHAVQIRGPSSRPNGRC